MQEIHPIRLVVLILMSMMIYGCASSEDEAKKLGFANAAEMKDIHSKGWHTKTRYEEDSAISAGFSSYSEMKKELERKRIVAEEKRKAEEVEIQKKKDAEERILNAAKYCKNDWTACTTMQMLYENFSGVAQINSKCESATKMAAKWDYQFIYSPAYSSYYNSATDLQEGKMRLVANDVKFQNGFGAWRGGHSTECYYDLKSQNAIMVHVR